MKKFQINQEFKKVEYELRVHKPDIAPYPQNVVKHRELLLFAQVHLCNILDSKQKNNKDNEKFETEMYMKIMETYYKWYDKEK